MSHWDLQEEMKSERRQRLWGVKGSVCGGLCHLVMHWHPLCIKSTSVIDVQMYLAEIIRNSESILLGIHRKIVARRSWSDRTAGKAFALQVGDCVTSILSRSRNDS